MLPELMALGAIVGGEGRAQAFVHVVLGGLRAVRRLTVLIVTCCTSSVAANGAVLGMFAYRGPLGVTPAC